jgi:hypothetical protein
MEYTTPPKPIPKILAPDSQIVIPSSAPSSHPSPNINSPSSLAIQSSVIDSNAITQASNILEIFELIKTPLMTPLISPILSEDHSTPIAISTIQKNQ